MNKIKVALFSTWYPLSMSRYFWEAFEDREDVELWVCGPFTGTFIPWNGGMNLPQKYVKTPDLSLDRALIGKPISSYLINNLMPWKPDLTITIDAGWHFSDRPAGEIVAHVQTDPHVLKDFYKPIKKNNDFNFCMQAVYSEPDEHYLPYAYSPRHHYPMDLEKEYDACIIGLHYPQRTQLVNRLLKRGLKVYYDIGVVYDEYRITNNKSKVGLNWSSLLDMNARAWELAAMGLCSVQNIVPDMATFFVESDHYLGFKDIDEAEKKVMLALMDDGMRQEIGDAARRKVLPHTWNARITQILETVRIK